MVEEARKRGRLVLATAYADYRRADMEDLQLVLFQLGFRLVHCPSWPSGGTLKSVVDPIMAQDLRDTLETHPTIDMFMIGTGDRDFIPVAHSLRYHGCQVVMVASPDCANRELIACADEYIPLPASTPRVIEPMLSHRRQPRQTRGRYAHREPVAASVTAPPAPVVQATVPVPVEPAAALLPTVPSTRPAVRQAVAPAPAQPLQRVQPAPVEAPIQPPRPAIQPVEVAPTNGAASSPAAMSREGVMEAVSRRQQMGEAPTPRQLARALVPDDDADGRLRSFVSNMVADLIKEGRLIRVQVRQHGRLVEAVALPGGIFGDAAHSIEAEVGATSVDAVVETGATAADEISISVESVEPVVVEDSTSVAIATEPEPPTFESAEEAGAPAAPASRRARSTTRRSTSRGRSASSRGTVDEATAEPPAGELPPSSESKTAAAVEAAPVEAAETQNEGATATTGRRRTRRPRAEAATPA